MRVNLIGNFEAKGLSQDAMLLRGLITNQFGKEASLRNIYHKMPQCPEADLNIFIEVLNPSLFTYAGKNVLVPNPEWTYKTWIPYLSMLDEIWVKTKEAEEIFKEWNPKFIGWTSIDKVFAEKKKYHKAIALVGRNMFRNPKPIIKAYNDIMNEDYDMYKRLPELHIPFKKSDIQFHVPSNIDKIFLYDELTEEKYDELLHECGLAICISLAEGFGHAVNEAMSAGCNLLLSPIGAFQELTDVALWSSPMQEMEHPDCMCTILDSSSKSIRECLEEYVLTPFKTKKQRSLKVREIYEKRHATFVESFKIPEYPVYSLSDTLQKETDLPDVSIITLTYNRKEFLPLAKYSYMIQSYPEDKLEWVIVNDGESIEEDLIGISNVKYIQLSEKTSIGEKRNIGVKNAMYDTICMMDDDDVYPNNSILERVAMLLKTPQKECVFCTTIPCYDIEKYTSFMNVPPITIPMSQRVSEATLCFNKKFWEERKFEGEMSEGDKFIQGREQMCREISPQEVIVSLVHSKNTSDRKTPEGEPNGCHYGFNEKLYAVVSEIGETLKTHAE